MREEDRSALLTLGIQPITNNPHGVAEPFIKRDRRVPVDHPVREKLRGGYAELVACAWLLEQGYEVFRNVCDRGEIDVIAIGHGKTFLVDVKSANVAQTGSLRFQASGGRLTEEQIARGIVALYVSPDGVCAWDLRILSAKLSGEV